ncbi:MAG TPA: gamma-glutamyltransferase [Candidatus Acidoferrum sp.]|nr:gamma-glutamyltransferase [Candidatus Acidoferrum sp.]
MNRALLIIAVVFVCITVRATSTPTYASKGVVVSQSEIASGIGAQVLRDGGNAIDASVATAFALAVTHPTAGNIGGGGFLVYRSAAGEAMTYDFRETAPAKAHAEMFLRNGNYDPALHHEGHVSVGVPGTVAGLHLAWRDHGKLPWKRLVEPAITLARDGFIVSHGLARDLERALPRMKKYPASLAQFSKKGKPFAAGDLLKQRDLARTLTRIAKQGAVGFYEGETAALIEKEMLAHDGLITRNDLKNYRAKKRTPVRGSYRGYEIISMPPPSSGGVALIEMLNVLEGFNVRTNGFGSAVTIHLMAEAMRRAFADRAQFLGDPDFTTIPIERLTSKQHADELRKTIRPDRASNSSSTNFAWPHESDQTTHLSVVDEERDAVALTYTLEYVHGSAIVVPGAGFLLNNEMGDFNAKPGLTTTNGLIGTTPNLAVQGKRMLSSMSPTIVTRDGKLFMVTGSPGGRTIINTVLQTIVNVIDFEMNAREAVDAPRFHHQWLPDEIRYERNGFSPNTLAILRQRGHRVSSMGSQGVAEVIVLDSKRNMLEAGCDRRAPDGAAVAE